MIYFLEEKTKQKLINIKNLYFIKEIIRINLINDLYLIRIIMKKIQINYLKFKIELIL